MELKAVPTNTTTTSHIFGNEKQLFCNCTLYTCVFVFCTFRSCVRPIHALKWIVLEFRRRGKILKTNCHFFFFKSPNGCYQWVIYFASTITWNNREINVETQTKETRLDFETVVEDIVISVKLNKERITARRKCEIYLCLPVVPNFVKRVAVVGRRFTSHDLRTVRRIQTLACVVEIETLTTRWKIEIHDIENCIPPIVKLSCIFF